MPLSDSLLPEFDLEMANTRKVLERVPEDKFGWKPHPKSGALGWLASHVADIPGWAVPTLGQSSLDINPPGGHTPPPLPASRAELLEKFDTNAKKGREALAKAADGVFMEPWSLLSGGATLFPIPKAAVLRSFVMNHLIHHRAQLGVYLRLNDIPVPAIYGPSADEQGMAAA
jgi:uncharacterized damage-inducible protein DinB